MLGPLPPPYGGARVSFGSFLDYLGGVPGLELVQLDLPVRNKRDHNPPGGVNHLRTMLAVLGCLPRLFTARSLVVFGSNNFCFSYGLILICAAKTVRKPCYVRFFGGHPLAGKERIPKWLLRVMLWVLGWADRVVVQTEVGKAMFPERLKQKTQVIHGYRPMLPAPENSANPHPPDRVRLAFVELKKVKGIEILMQGATRLQEQGVLGSHLEIHLYGHGSAKWQEAVTKQPGFVYHGRQPNDVLRAAMRDYDGFLFPSIYHNEGHPGVLIEAFMAGLPVISSNLPGPREIVGHEKNGLLFPAGDVDAFVEAIIRLVEEPQLRSQLAHGAAQSGGRFDERVVRPRLARALGLLEPADD